MTVNKFEGMTQAGVVGPDSQLSPRSEDSVFASGVALKPESHAWIKAEREIGEAPAVRKRQVRKAWGSHQNPLTADLDETVLDLIASTSNPRAVMALTRTRNFVRKHGGVVAPRPDHGTINDDGSDVGHPSRSPEISRRTIYGEGEVFVRSHKPRPELPPEVQAEHSIAGQISADECQPAFARANGHHPFVVSDKAPAPAAVKSSRIKQS